MPIWLRKFTFNTIQEHLDKIDEARKKASGKQTLDPPKGPGIKPNFTTKKASK